MGEFLKWLVGWPWCAHRWQIVDRCSYQSRFGDRVIASGERLTMQCTKCGDVKKRDLI